MRELGGLFICGTERHESRRIDNQLRGRAGRQGDPGETRFFLSAEDDVIRLFSGDRIFKILDRLGPVDEDGTEMPLEAKMLTKTVENAQKKVEEQNFLIRKRVLEYDDVMNEQRRVVYKYRREILEGRDISETARDELEGVIERLVDEYTSAELLEEWDMGELETQLRLIWPVSVDVATLAPETVEREQLKDELDEDAMSAYDEREEQLGVELMRHLERSILLQVIDNRWREHLFDMDYLREGIHLRGFAQIDPLVAYKNEGFTMFEELMHAIWDEFSKLIFRAEIEVEPAQGNGGGKPPRSGRPGLLRRHPRGQPSALEQVASGGAASAIDVATAEAPARANGDVVETVVKDEHDKIGRNDPCWCGVGKEVQEVSRSLRRCRRISESSHDPGPGVHPGLQRARPRRVRRGARPGGRDSLQAGAAQGGRGGAAVGDPEAGRRAADDRAGAALRGRDRGRRRAGRGADRPPLALGRGRRQGPRGCDGLVFELHDHRIRSWRPYEDREEALRAGGFGQPGAAG